jgi:alkylated DNA repair dioxygenase AlkB
MSDEQPLALSCDISAEPPPKRPCDDGIVLPAPDFSASRKAAQQRRDLLARLRNSLSAWESGDTAQQISGLAYIPEFITSREEQTLLDNITENTWDASLTRRVQHYGWRYNYKKRTVDKRDYLGPLPKWIEYLQERMRRVGLIEETTVFDQVIINEYLVRQGIKPHIDQPQVFGAEVVTLSLGSSTVMDFAPTQSEHSPIHLTLAPRSVTRLRDHARYKWTHGIAARDSDPTPHGGKLMRGKRVSITFRTVIQ